MEGDKTYIQFVLSQRERLEIIKFIQKIKGICEKGDLSKYTMIAWRNLITSDYISAHTQIQINSNNKRDKDYLKTKHMMENIIIHLQEKMVIKKGQAIPIPIFITALCTVEKIAEQSRTHNPKIKKLIYHGFIEMNDGYREIDGIKTKVGEGSYKILDLGIDMENEIDV